MTPDPSKVSKPRPGARFDPGTGRALTSSGKPGIVMRLLTMLMILLPLWIAATLVNNLISEREGVRASAEAEISEKWGNDQVLAGPVLVLPWIERERVDYRDDKGVQRSRVEEHRRTATFLPDQLKVSGDLKPELRRRGIFETVLYVAQLGVEGSFSEPDLRSVEIPSADVLWDKAVLSVSVTDPRGIRDAIVLKWGGQKLAFKPGAGEGSPFGVGFHVQGLPVKALGKGTSFSFDMGLNGSRTLKFVPVGRSNDVTLGSAWPDPSFNGEYLPVERKVDEKGFQASWKVLELARKFPQAWRNGSGVGGDLAASAFGVGLIRTASTYQQSARATKYAILFLLLTFTFFFLFEVLGDLRVHPVQYLLVGAALVVFYLLLLSVSEHIGFNGAYWLSTLATLGILWSYVSAVLKQPQRARLLLATLGGLYGYLFVILRLNDYSLLMGSLGIFAALGALMWFTRHIDWYALDKKS